MVGEFPRSGAEDVAAAVQAAEAAWPRWSRLPAAQRGAFLARAADLIEARVEEIAQDMTREMGKPRVGIVGLITPWNFPAAIPAWKTGPALAYGNAVVLKLAQDAPLTGLHLARARGGGAPGRRPERRGRSRLGGRRAARRAPASPRDLLHGLGASGAGGARALRASRQARPAGARRPQPAHRRRGYLHINSQTAGADVHVPFGGSKASGYGPHEQGRAAIEFYTEEITIYHDV